MGWLSKMKWGLLGCLIVLLLQVAGSVFMPGGLTNTVKWVANNESASRLRALVQQEEAQDNTLIEMAVETIGVSNTTGQPVIILKEKDGELYLPVWIGLLEANAISVMLEGVEMPRPLTADLLYSTINKMDASVDYVAINDLQNNTFYGSIVLNANWTRLEIDSRPSDAIAIALRARAPIYVQKAVLDKAGIQSDDKKNKYGGSV